MISVFLMIALFSLLFLLSRELPSWSAASIDVTLLQWLLQYAPSHWGVGFGDLHRMVFPQSDSSSCFFQLRGFRSFLNTRLKPWY